VRTLVELARAFGARGIARRASHEVLLRTRAYRAIAARPAPTTGFEPLPLDLVRVRAVFARHPEVATGVVGAAEAMLAGRYPYFTNQVLDVGWPPPWNVDPRTGRSWDASVHWTEVDQSGRSGDVKWVWEASRFAFAWLLARAFVATGDARYASELRGAIRHWSDHNPPYRGPAWSCAQETSLRAIAVVFAASALGGGDPLVCRLLYASGRRTSATLHYALSQRNNHALSEAIGLFTIAVTCPSWRESARWREVALRALGEAVRDQFGPDGAYIQESLNYHRLALQLLLWARFVARSTAARLPGEIEDVLGRSLDLVAGLLPAEGGAGIATTRGCGLPAPSYSVVTPA